MKKFKLLALAFVVATTSLFAVNAELPDVPVNKLEIKLWIYLKFQIFYTKMR